MEERECPRCKETLPLDKDHWYMGKRRGLARFISPCKACERKRQRDYQQTPEGRAKRRVTLQVYRAKRPESREPATREQRTQAAIASALRADALEREWRARQRR